MYGGTLENKLNLRAECGSEIFSCSQFPIVNFIS
jgi:hypothetical protein